MGTDKDLDLHLVDVCIYNERAYAMGCMNIKCVWVCVRVCVWWALAS